MAFWKDLSIRGKLFVLVALAVVSLLAFGAMSFFAISEVKVGSKIAETAHMIGNIGGDIEDPAMSPLIAYPWAMRAQRSSSPEEIHRLAAKVHDFRTTYEQSYAGYMTRVPPGAVRDEMTVGEQAAESWYEMAERQYFPALAAGRTAEATDLWQNRMEPVFLKSTDSIARLTALLGKWSDENDRESNRIVRSRISWMIAVGVIALLVIVALGQVTSSSVVAGVQKMVTVLASLANRDLTVEVQAESKDEIGQMMISAQSTILSFREVMQAIRQSAEMVASASAQMTAAADVTAKVVSENALAAQQAAATMAEMDATVQEVSKGSQTSSRAAQSTEEAAVKGNLVVHEAVDAVKGIASSTLAVERRIVELGRSSEQIGKIVHTINEIAEQTNLLALNAAIEAARAGEHGRGFAVVAGEVRRLAERTTAATKEIEGMIHSIQTETAETVDAMHTGSQQVEIGLVKTSAMGDALHSIQQLSQQSGAQIEQIAAATAEQVAAIQEITENIHRISEFVQQTSASATESAAACRGLADLATDLQAQAGRFRMP